MTDQPKQLTSPKESVKARGAFLLYFNLGEERNLPRVVQECAKKHIKISISGVKKWSKQFQWVKRVEAMDKEAQSRAEEIAIQQATVKKSDILKAVKNTMIKYNQAILSGDIIPNAHDFYRMWELQRKELGKDTEAPSPIKIEINQRILSIVQKAEEDARQIIEEEIENEPD